MVNSNKLRVPNTLKKLTLKNVMLSLNPLPPRRNYMPALVVVVVVVVAAAVVVT